MFLGLFTSRSNHTMEELHNPWMDGCWCHVGSLKLAMVGIFTPWKWVNVPDSLSFLEEPVDKCLPALLC